MSPRREHHPIDETLRRLGVREDAGRFHQRNLDPHHRRELPGVHSRGEDHDVELEISRRGANPGQPPPFLIDRRYFRGEDDTGALTARVIHEHFRGTHRVEASLLLAPGRGSDFPGLDIPLEFPELLQFDQAGGIAPALVRGDFLPEPSRSLRLVVPLEASAPLHLEVPPELALEVAITESAEPVQVVVVMGLLGEGRVDPGEGVRRRPRCRFRLFEERDVRTPAREVIGDGGAQDAPAHDADPPRRRESASPSRKRRDRHSGKDLEEASSIHGSNAKALSGTRSRP